MVKRWVWVGLLCFSFAQGEVQMLPNAIKPLPYPVSNHAVAVTSQKDKKQFYVFNGLTGDKTHAGVTKQAWVYKDDQWQKLEVPLLQKPVLASVAVTINNDVYLFGGYTVAADHSEVSVPNVWQVNGDTLEWTALPAMPMPVDDSVALVYQKRYIYLISGWHDVDNVNLVQVFDTLNKTWHQASPFPLPPVFGHAGGIIEKQMVVCDGVKVIWETDKKKRFEPSPACAIGVINEHDHLIIDWHKIPHHSGVASYRMAAASGDESQFIFVGGSDNPYNFNGIGYNGQPSSPSDAVRIYDSSSQKWQIIKNKIPATMDHRGLLKDGDRFIIMGGMKANQTLSPQVMTFKLDPKSRDKKTGKQ